MVTPIADITSADQVLAMVGYYIYNYLFITKFQLPTNSEWQLLTDIPHICTGELVPLRKSDNDVICSTSHVKR